MNRRALVIGAALIAGSLAAGGTALAVSKGGDEEPGERQSEQQFTDAHRREAKVSQQEAERIAKEARPGQVVDSHLQDEEGQGLRWEVKTDDGSQIWEVQVDPNSGNVVSNQPDE
jgi:uncharacterized membrane protein YkoI